MKPDFKKGGGLIPAIIQHANTQKVLMLGYMNEESWKRSRDEGVVWFYSRSKDRLWKKGETSGYTLKLVSMELDCDQDAFLIQVLPAGPVCHKGHDTCFGDVNAQGFIYELQATIHERNANPVKGSYTSSLFEEGINKIAQKVGEEVVELVIESLGKDEDLFKNEAADLVFHLLVLLEQKGLALEDIEEILKSRRK
jgi:phosphoribosyl-ATP pyrophosphohydrolase/phosphoribosyl-AMP cyclohydrolase